MPCSGCSALYRVNLNNKKTASRSVEISDDPGCQLLLLMSSQRVLIHLQTTYLILSLVLTQ